MHTLLSKKKTDKFEFVDNGDGFLKCKKSRSVAIKTFDKWLEAFHTFVAIYSSKLLSKCDVESAFMLIPISPVDFELQAISIDITQGLSYSCALFETFSSALHWMAEKKLGIPGCAHILDDLLFVCPPDYGVCFFHLIKFLNMASVPGVPIKDEKLYFPVLH